MSEQFVLFFKFMTALWEFTATVFYSSVAGQEQLAVGRELKYYMISLGFSGTPLTSTKKTVTDFKNITFKCCGLGPRELMI